MAPIIHVAFLFSLSIKNTTWKPLGFKTNLKTTRLQNQPEYHSASKTAWMPLSNRKASGMTHLCDTRYVNSLHGHVAPIILVAFVFSLSIKKQPKYHSASKLALIPLNSKPTWMSLSNWKAFGMTLGFLRRGGEPSYFLPLWHKYVNSLRGSNSYDIKIVII